MISTCSTAPHSEARRYVLVYGAPRDIAGHLRAIAHELELGVAEPLHLQATCRALAQFPGALLFLSSTVKPWDRDVALEHATRARAEVVGLDPGFDAELRSGALRQRLERWARRGSPS